MVTGGNFRARYTRDNTVLRSMLEHGNELLAEDECNHETLALRYRFLLEEAPNISGLANSAPKGRKNPSVALIDRDLR